MTPSETIRQTILDEMNVMEDWVSLAGALEALGTSSFHAHRNEVAEVIECINNDDSLQLRSATERFTIINKPIPTDRIIDSIFIKSAPADRAARMMELFIDSDELRTQPDRPSAPERKQ